MQGSALCRWIRPHLRQAKARFDWGRDAFGTDAISGMSGNRAAIIIAGEMATELRDEDEETRARQDLTRELLDQDRAVAV